MSMFGHPGLLPLLAIPIAWGFGQWLARGQQVALPLDQSPAPSGWRMDSVLRLLSLTPALLLAIAILLLARPLVEGPPDYPREVTNIQLVLDTSGSMNEPFGTRVHKDGNAFTRFDAAMSSIDQFMRSRAGDAFGLSIFTEKVIHWVPLTTDLSAIRLATPFVRPGAFPLEWWDRTLVGNAIETASELLETRSDGGRMMIVLTDGETPDMADGRAVEIGQALKAKQIVLYAISVRAEGASNELQTACEISGGRLFESGDQQGLHAVFQDIDRLQPVQLSSAQPRWLDCNRPIALVGLGLLALLQIANLGLRYTPW